MSDNPYEDNVPEHPQVPPTPPNNPESGQPPVTPANPAPDAAAQPPFAPVYPPVGPVYPQPDFGYPPVGPGYPPPGPAYPPPGFGYPPVGPGYPPPGPGYPPPPYPGYPGYPGYNAGYGYGTPPPQPLHPLPLGEAIRQLPKQYWRVLTRPRVSTFTEETSKAAWNIVWVQLAIYAVVAAVVIVLLFTVALPTMFSSMMPPSNAYSTNGYPGVNPADTLIQLYRTFGVAFGIASFFLTFIGFFIGAGLNYLIAKLYKGHGSFLQYCYGYTLLYIPIGIITLILYLIASTNFLALLLFSFIGFAVGVYMYILLVFMTMAVMRMSGGRATLAVLTLPIIGFLLSCILDFVIVTTTLNTIHQFMPTPPVSQ